MEMTNKVVKKTSMGRQRIEIKKIEKSSQLQVTFSKRRTGVFKKAGELSILSGAHVAIIVSSPAGKVFAFGSPSVESVLDRYLAGNPSVVSEDEEEERRRVEQMSMRYKKVVGKLDVEKEREKVVEAAKVGFWWNENIDNLDLNELEQYRSALEVLKMKVKNKADEKMMAAAAASSLLLNFSASGGGGAVVDPRGFNIDLNPF